jgi:hypothetical protein
MSLLEAPEGPPETIAGSHPYSMTTKLVFNHEVLEEEEGVVVANIYGEPKNVRVNLPPGLIVNPLATETRCTEAQLKNGSRAGGCPDSAAVGVVTTYISGFGLPADPGGLPSPIYNMVPPAGVPAALAFNVGKIGIVVHIGGSVRTGEDYGLSADVREISQLRKIWGAKVTLWGNPSDVGHDKERGFCMEEQGRERVEAEEREREQEIAEHGTPNPNRTFFCTAERTNRPFLTMPGSCNGEPLTATAGVDSWQEPGVTHQASASAPALSGCASLDFSPRLSVQPDVKAADSASGLNVDLRIPQEESVRGLAEANLKDAVVTLPPGMSASPSAANGLGACAPAEISLNDARPPSCPETSKLASVEVLTPLLERPLKGSVYLAQPGHNPFGSLVALYLVAEGSGALIKLAGQVTLDPVSGQLSASFENNPQLPFTELKVQFFGGPRGPLVTPQGCGAYETTSSLAPWSGTPAATPSEAFTIDSGPGGGPCPGGQFAPSFSAGTTDNQAGGFSPLSVTLSRADGEQHLASTRVTMPPGLLGVLNGVERCPEPQASQGACGRDSLIGHTTTSAGPGPQPFYVGGNVFLTGPYKGAPFGLSVVVHAVAGPFDLGNVVVRAKVDVDPGTAQVTVTSDPFPTILQGITLDVRLVNVSVDRAGFIVNPTNCAALSVKGTIASTDGTVASVASPFEAANCATLPFKPTFGALTASRTSKRDGVSLHVHVGAPAGSANIAKARVVLPKQLPSRLTTLQKACIDVVFDANPATCPPGSYVGTATAVTPLLAHPLTGPAILVSHGGAQFPDLVVVLQGEGITLNLVGNTDIKHGFTSSTFNALPDAPVSSFDLVLPQGPHSALGANLSGGARGSMCRQRLVMPTSLTGQNGAVFRQSTRIAVSGCPTRPRRGRRATRSRHGEHSQPRRVRPRR